MGIFTAHQVIIFIINKENVSKELESLTTSFTNSIIMSFGIFFHLIIGFIIELIGKDSNTNYYHNHAYQGGVSAIAIFALFGSFLTYYFLVRKKAS